MAQPDIPAYLPPANAFDSPSFDFEIGTKCEIQHFERVKNAKGDIITLKAGQSRSTLSKHPADIRSAKAALVVTRDAEHIERPRTSIEIQSPHMLRALKRFVPEYENVDLDTQTITLQDQLRCVFHYRRELSEHHDDRAAQGQVDAAQHLAFLLNYMYNSLHQEIRQFRRFMENPTIQPALEYVNLWMAFIPGQVIYVDRKCNHNKMRGRSFRLGSMKRCPCTEKSCPDFAWSLTGDVIDYDGMSNFGYTSVFYSIEPFEGVQALHDLVVVPLEYLPDRESLRSELIARGKKFVRFSDQHHLQYEGVANLLSDDRDVNFTGKEDFFPLESIYVNGRVIIDCEAFSEARPTHQPYINGSKKRFSLKQKEHLEMSEEEYMICRDAVAGYSLNDKQWGWFKVDHLQDIDFNDNAFDALILEDSQKATILSLVKSCTTGKVAFDDVIKGKGKGLVFLLHGEPGTGKTLTAESIADFIKAPLIRIDTGMLGSTAKELEESIKQVFTIAEKWNAIMLLDEADVFLERRDRTDIERNRLVAVFLRALEYFDGILFLTTNRVEAFDRALISRVHLGIFYPLLDADSRFRIWKTMLSQSGIEVNKELLQKEHLCSIADKTLNGRQIKNAVRIACALAKEEGCPMKEDHLKFAVKAMEAFDRDVSSAVTEVDQQVQEGIGQPSRKRRRPVVED